MSSVRVFVIRELVTEKYPIGTIVSGAVRNLTNYGAFVEIEPGIDGLLHVSDISWTEKIAHPNEKYKKGDEVECMVLEIDLDKQRISLGIKQMHEDPWQTAIPEAYKPGMVVHGTVTKIKLWSTIWFAVSIHLGCGAACRSCFA